jgi:hypothetical protein
MLLILIGQNVVSKQKSQMEADERCGLTINMCALMNSFSSTCFNCRGAQLQTMMMVRIMQMLQAMLTEVTIMLRLVIVTRNIMAQ